MPRFESVDEVLDFAIREETEAEAFYRGLAERMEHGAMRDALLEFAGEEQRHHDKLVAVKAGARLQRSHGAVMDLGLAEELTDQRPSPDMDYRDALALAMKKEEAARRLYEQLAEAAAEPALKETFLALANEEARHKLRFELEYDEQYLEEM